MTGYTSNRPERCGTLRGGLIGAKISADAAADHLTDPGMLIRALREIANAAAAAISRDADMAAADQLAFSQHLAGLETAEPAEIVHECGTPAEPGRDTSAYPVPMTVSQRDPADPESWVFRCTEGHPSDYAAITTGEIGMIYGWQSADYASEDDALISAADHARAMHDGGLPSDLAERAAAASERAEESLDAATAVAAAAPRKRGKYISDTLIYWPLIERLRDALDAEGVDWRAAGTARKRPPGGPRWR
jgi:hypothetical protein